ncbi:hypothetical protein GCM10020358_46310 [Amorphoplanes nipponensis]|uniref:Uncharacterized protein n=1 Tax=Actinoplanes nipponensis TaxID=135950 RepID=A0A919MQC2_9ACTN|nr:hypothetical protein [Actinoplanes nipponensis]GIE53496.1 hypothetical protein Ani05nite_70300 [Actinoplanes nipponensis]
MGVALPLSEGEFDDVLRRVDDGLQKVVDLSNKIVDACNRIGQWLGPLWDDVVDLLNKFVDLVQKLLSEIGKFFTRPGVPWSLWNHGTDWVKEVGGPVSDLISQATTGQTDIDERWQGPAATAYLGTLPDQGKALAAIVAATADIDDALTKVAGGIIAFWLGVLAAIVPFIIELTGWGAAASTGVGAPPAAAGAGASTLKALGIITAVVTAAITYLTAISSQYKDLLQRVENNDGFPGGHWPRSTNDVIADGSLTGDQTTNWHLRTS